MSDAPSAASPARSGDLPTIVLVVFDTARWERFGCYGYERPTTPTVDSLAAEGLRAETMIANGPWTLPAHGSMFTGLYPSQHGSQWQTGPRLRDSATVTLAEWLRALGYDTWCVTNNGLISERTGLARGFDHYAFRLDIERGWRRAARRIPKALFGGDSGGRVVNRWMRKRLPEAERPLFLFVNYMGCHWAYAPPRRMARRMRGPRYGPLRGLRYRTHMAARVGPWEAIARAEAEDLEVYSTYYDGELANVDRHLGCRRRARASARNTRSPNGARGPTGSARASSGATPRSTSAGWVGTSSPCATAGSSSCATTTAGKPCTTRHTMPTSRRISRGHAWRP